MKKITQGIHCSFVSFVFIFLFSISAKSQTITIGSGTQTNGYNEASPVNITRERAVSWIVYTAAELNAAGISGPSTINKMGFFVTNIPVNDIPNYTIQMKHTNATSAGNNPGNTGYTVVKNAFTYAPSQGDWDMLDLDTPFDWNGTQNIAIKICWSNVNNDPSGQLRTFNSTNGYRYRWTNWGSGSYCGSTPNTNRQWKPQIRFVFDTETIWTGLNSTNWFDAGNWTAGVPDATMDTRIPIGAPNYPILNGTANTAKFTLEGSMTNGASGILNVNGDFLNSGTYNDNGGMTVLTGEGPNLINNTSGLDISNLIIESKFGASMSGSPVTITEELQVNKSSFNTNDSITLRSDASGTARIAALTTNCFYQLVMNDAWGDGWNGATLTILEDGVPIYVVQAYGSSTTETIPVANGSNLQLQYSSGQFENENSYTLYDPSGTPIFSDGPNPSTGIVYSTTTSCAFSDPISGEITMERYIDAGATYWRFFGSAVQGATVGQYNDDFITSGYPGSHFPTFPFTSVYTFDETLGPGLGYVPCSGTSQVFLPGQGFQVWCGDTITGTQPFTVDLTGVPNQGDISLPVTYTNTGDPSEDGWNLVSNPYPSTIDWESSDWTKSNVANAVYILDPDAQQYATYVSGASTNGGSRYIASQQSFWVYTFGNSPQLDAKEEVKADIDQAFFKSTISPGMKIKLVGSVETDEAIIRNVPGTTEQVEYEYDALKLWGGWGLYPQLSVMNNLNEELTVHSFDDLDTGGWSIPLKTIVFQDGNHDLVFENINELNVPCLMLEDTYTGDMYPIEESVPLTFYMTDTMVAPRFIIHAGKNYQSNIQEPLCSGGTEGEIILDLDMDQYLDYSITVNGNTTYDTDYGDPLLITDLIAGFYTIEVPSLVNLCDQTEFTFYISEPSPIVSNSTVIDETYGNDGSIEVTMFGGTPPYSYLWNTGDDTPIIQGLSAGTYSLIIQDDNGCSWNGDFYVNSLVSVEEEIESSTAFVYNSDQNLINITGWQDGEMELILYSINGGLIQVYSLNANENQEINIPGSLAEGVYFIKGQDKVYLKFVK